MAEMKGDRAVPVGPGSVRIYHNPRCSKSRDTLKLIEATGLTPEIVLYLSDPPGRKELEKLLVQLGRKPSELARKGEKLFKELGLDTATEDAILAAMLAHPLLIERPIVVTSKGARLGRPPEAVTEILPA